MTNTKTQCRETQPWYDSRGLEKWSTGHCLEVHRHGVVRDGTQGGPGDPTAIHSSPTVHYRNTDLEVNKTGFRVMKSTKKKYLNYVKQTMCSKLKCNMNCRPVKKKQGFKVLASVQKGP